MKIALVVLMTSWIGTARAADEDDEDDAAAGEVVKPDPPPFLGWHGAITGTFGLATPLGIAGLEVEARYARWISLAAGIGIGLSVPAPQFTTMARFGVPLGGLTTLRFGLGVSGGPYKWVERPVKLCISPSGTCPSGDEKAWELAYWANGELGVELRFKKTRLKGRPFVGFSHILNWRDYKGAVDGEDTHAGEWMIYTGFSLVREF